MTGEATRSAATRASVGVGLRPEIHEAVLHALRESPSNLRVDFFELAPENYMRRGGYLPHIVEQVAARFPILSHGLTMSFGGVDPIEPGYLAELRAFIERWKLPFHSDHLCFSGGGGRIFHDLFPLPLFEETAVNAVARIREVQDRLGVPVAIENISYYLTPGAPEMSEGELVSRIVRESGCGLLLDVNNVYVNATNHGFDARAYIAALPLDEVVQIHVAGHEWRPGHELIIDTHGADVIDPVLDLLEFTVERTGSVPVLLERDNDVPPLPTLLEEIDRIRARCDRALARRAPCEGPKTP